MMCRDLTISNVLSEDGVHLAKITRVAWRRDVCSEPTTHETEPAIMGPNREAQLRLEDSKANFSAHSCTKLSSGIINIENSKIQNHIGVPFSIQSPDSVATLSHAILCRGSIANTCPDRQARRRSGRMRGSLNKN
jgi:hypothetical protein